ncbi:MAG: NAD(P)/FAD-dependent oxidoreductase [Desulfobacteraceae bacterium]|nr:NAD(P)/FAD-dependent oxidoreductase [Desulfobacteraceae bacterium]
MRTSSNRVHSKIDSKCDVAIIGAGPAGSTCACLLAKKGFNVTVFDKKVFPRQKVCAGLITWKTADLIKRIFNISFEELCKRQIIKNSCRDYRVFYLKKEIGRGILDFPFHFVDRPSYDSLWMQHALSAGAQIHTGMGIKAIEPEKKTVVTDTGRHIKAKIIIGADGALSTVRKVMQKTGIEKQKWRKQLAMTIEIRQQCTENTLCPQFSSLHFGFVPWGYAWSFPGKSTHILGICSIPHKNKEPFKAGFEKFLKASGYYDYADTPRKGHPLPYGNFISTPSQNGIFLVGDACGLADPLLGEGIYYAHLSAQLAAHAIGQARPDYGRAEVFYNKMIRKKILREFKRIRLYRDLLFFDGRYRRYKGLRFFLRLFPKRLEAAIQGTGSFSNLLFPIH